MGNDTDIRLMQQSHERMQKDMDNLTKTVVEGFEKIGNKLDSQREENFKTFATKEDHKRNEKSIIDLGSRTGTLERAYWKAMGIITIVVPIVTFLCTILYEKLFSK